MSYWPVPEDNKIYYSKPCDPEKVPDIVCVEYLPCKCGKTLEDALQLNRTTFVCLDFSGKEFTQKVVCWECAKK